MTSRSVPNVSGGREVPDDLGGQRHRLPSPHLVEQVAVGALHHDQFRDERSERVHLLVARPETASGKVQFENSQSLQPVQDGQPQPLPAVGLLHLQPAEAAAGQGGLDQQRRPIRAGLLGQRH
jgi:hypothetical protein